MSQTMHTVSASLPKVSVLILAGGRATRMHGVDKGLVQLNGMPLTQRLFNVVASESDEILINANRHLEQYQQLFPNCTIISDHWSDYRGPLAGIYAGLQHCKHEYLFVVPCDLFALPASCLEKMFQAIQNPQYKATYAVINSDALYPLCLTHKNALPELEKVLHNHQYAVRSWLFSVNAVPTHFQMPLDMPLNLNNPDALRAASLYQLTQHDNAIQELS